MKQSLDPKVLIAVIVVGVLLLAWISYRAFTGPATGPAAGGPQIKPGSPHGEGPTAADLQKMRDYNRTHPGAASSYR